MKRTTLQSKMKKLQIRRPTCNAEISHFRLYFGIIDPIQYNSRLIFTISYPIY